MTHTRLYYLGLNRGFSMALAYATGTKAARRAIRTRLAMVAPSYSQFGQGVYCGFSDAAEQRSEHILAGRAPRTCSPYKLRNLLNRVG